jgi:hypothetical protein
VGRLRRAEGRGVSPVNVSALGLRARGASAASRVVCTTYCGCLHERLWLVIPFLGVVHGGHLHVVRRVDRTSRIT